ncbi:hypothetical protein GJ629_05885 [Halapricum sp. CBA1109]|uniref:UPF0175 family protein n=1 Tax=Halapricum sp. CBA1109 TaxID=2668068 RepID=UPI0012FA6872|nr:UPF0175 family protein [Halapricum sp. CBA1109]MUV89482.1 hypothetical protein [Halapricum sp. CBA1109]
MASSERPEPSDEIATAVGRYVLGDVSLGKAAESVGMSRWEFEELLSEAGFDALYGPRTSEDLDEEVDAARRIDE